MPIPYFRFYYGGKKEEGLANPLPGRLTIWRERDREHDYVIGADVASGLESGNCSAAVVLDWNTKEQVVAHSAQAPIAVTVVMLPKEHEAFEGAMARAKQELGKGAWRGELWAHVCRSYLRQVDQMPEPAGESVSESPSSSQATDGESVGILLRPLGQQ